MVSWDRDPHALVLDLVCARSLRAPFFTLLLVRPLLLVGPWGFAPRPLSILNPLADPQYPGGFYPWTLFSWFQWTVLNGPGDILSLACWLPGLPWCCLCLDSWKSPKIRKSAMIPWPETLIVFQSNEEGSFASASPSDPEALHRSSTLLESAPGLRAHIVHCYALCVRPPLIPSEPGRSRGVAHGQSWAPIIGKGLDESTMSVPALVF